MTDITVYCNGATVTGQLKSFEAGRPMAGPVRGDRQTLRITLTVVGDDTQAHVDELMGAIGMEPTPMTVRAALTLALHMLEAEERRLDVDAAAYSHGCEESEPNAKRQVEISQARRLIQEMLIDDQV